jgi:excisionase family DNA binding protein
MTVAQPDTGTFLTVAEVAAFYRISRWSVYARIREGRWATVKVGRSTRIVAADVYAEYPVPAQ